MLIRSLLLKVRSTSYTAAI